MPQRAWRGAVAARGRGGQFRCGGRVAAVLVLGSALAALALEPTTPLASYGRQSWVMENGLPQNTVQALVQTRDGFVWLGTEVGLVRFDGSGFTVFDRNSTPALPGNDVRCLLETRDGALWIGTSDGLARMKDGAVTAFTTKDGLPGNAIRALVEASNGTLFVWTDQGIAQQAGDRFVAKGNVDAWPQTANPSSGEQPGDVRFEVELANDEYLMGDRHSLRLYKRNKKPAGPSTQLTVGMELPGSRSKSY